VTAADRGQGTVVVYQADDIDTATRTGWSVMVAAAVRNRRPVARGHVAAVVAQVADTRAEAQRRLRERLPR
jgi:hypothetical protein